MTYHCDTRKSRAGSGKKVQDEGIDKAGPKRRNRVSDVGKQEREGGRKREVDENEIHFYSSRKYKLAIYIYSIPLGVRIVLQNNSSLDIQWRKMKLLSKTITRRFKDSRYLFLTTCLAHPIDVPLLSSMRVHFL